MLVNDGGERYGSLPAMPTELSGWTTSQRHTFVSMSRRLTMSSFSTSGIT